MPLSEHEQRLLDQIEQALYAEDPKFASNVRGKRLRKPSRGKRLQGIVLFAIGITLLPLGVMVQVRLAEIPILSVVGFLLMFFGVLLFVTSMRAQPEAEVDTSGEKQDGKSAKRSSFSQRMEERFRHRFDDR
ncbi:DUF3040 domain-containing protein [Haloechinothrix halophila]|uniref:DUF3040 domain-containing protein n=1 Tax=Haloechinothrix halophila TaxID=1069073 RepID=UPI0004130B72|nr:DUF3040 domain-containing protein [Haloechinothrix halophila]